MAKHGKGVADLFSRVCLARRERAQIRAWQDEILAKSTRDAYNLGLRDGIRIEQKRRELDEDDR